MNFFGGDDEEEEEENSFKPAPKKPLPLIGAGARTQSNLS